MVGPVIHRAQNIFVLLIVMEEFTEALSVVAKGYDLRLPDWVSN